MLGLCYFRTVRIAVADLSKHPLDRLEQPMKKRVFSLPLTFGTIAALVVGCSTSPSETATQNALETSSVTTDQIATSATNATVFSDGVLSTPDLRIEILDYKVIPVGEVGNEYGDKPVMAIWYNTTNLGDGEVTPMEFITYFRAVQDNNPNSINELEVASLPDDRFLDSQLEKIKKNGTVENAMAYSLDDETTPVELIAEDFIGNEEFGRQTLDLKY